MPATTLEQVIEVDALGLLELQIYGSVIEIQYNRLHEMVKLCDQFGIRSSGYDTLIELYIEIREEYDRLDDLGLFPDYEPEEGL